MRGGCGRDNGGCKCIPGGSGPEGGGGSGPEGGGGKCIPPGGGIVEGKGI